MGEESWAKFLRPIIVMIPYWVARSLMFIGVWYIVLFPFHINWYGYGLSLVVALAYGLWIRHRWRVKVLERSDRGIVYWVRRVKRGEKETPKEPTSPPVLTPRQ
jgi:hypothetical protein